MPLRRHPLTPLSPRPPPPPLCPAEARAAQVTATRLYSTEQPRSLQPSSRRRGADPTSAGAKEAAAGAVVGSSGAAVTRGSSLDTSEVSALVHAQVGPVPMDEA